MFDVFRLTIRDGFRNYINKSRTYSYNAINAQANFSMVNYNTLRTTVDNFIEFAGVCVRIVVHLTLTVKIRQLNSRITHLLSETHSGLLLRLLNRRRRSLYERCAVVYNTKIIAVSVCLLSEKRVGGAHTADVICCILSCLVTFT